MNEKMKELRLNNRVRKAFQGRSRGFSLIEVVIAIALLGLIGAAILSALSTASLALIIADKRATAESLARSQMEHVKNSDYDDVLESGHPQYSLDPDILPLPPGYTVDTAAVRLDQDEDPNDDDGIQQITINVSHDDEVVVTLEDYKRDPDV